MVFVTFLTAALLLASWPIIWGHPHRSAIQYLTSATLEPVIYQNSSSTDRWLVLFHDTDNERSQLVASALEDAAQQVGLGEGIRFGIIDCSASKTEEDYCYEEKKVTFTPFLMYIHPEKRILGRKEEDYIGETSPDALIKFARKVASESVVPVAGFHDAQDNLLGASSLNGVGFIAYDPAAKGDTVDEIVRSSRILRAFVAAAERAHFLGPAFGVLVPSTTQEDLQRLGFGVGSKGVPATYVVRIESGMVGSSVGHKPYHGLHNSWALYNHIRKNDLAAITHLERTNFDAMANRGKPLAIMFHRDGSASVQAIDHLRQYSLSGPSNVTDKYIFSAMDGNKWYEYRKHVGIQSRDLPALAIFDHKQDTRNSLAYEKMVGTSNLQSFLEEVAAEASARRGGQKKFILTGVYIAVICFLCSRPLRKEWLDFLEELAGDSKTENLRRGKREKLVVDAEKKEK